MGAGEDLHGGVLGKTFPGKDEETLELLRESARVTK